MTSTVSAQENVNQGDYVSPFVVKMHFVAQPLERIWMQIAQKVIKGINIVSWLNAFYFVPLIMIHKPVMDRHFNEYTSLFDSENTYQMFKRPLMQYQTSFRKTNLFVFAGMQRKQVLSSLCQNT